MPILTFKTSGEGVASKVGWAVADGVVVVYFTQGQYAANAFTWVFTPLTNASFVRITFRVR